MLTSSTLVLSACIIATFACIISTFIAFNLKKPAPIDDQGNATQTKKNFHFEVPILFFNLAVAAFATYMLFK